MQPSGQLDGRSLVGLLHQPQGQVLGPFGLSKSLRQLRLASHVATAYAAISD